MKNKLLLIIATVSLVSLSGCFDDPGSEILFEEAAFVELDAATVGGRTYLFQRLNNGTTYDAGFKVGLGATANSAGVSCTFEIDDSSTAIEGVHYTLGGTTVNIPAGQFSAELPITILADGIEAGEKLTIVVNITGSDVAINPNFSTATHTIQITCPSNLAGMYDVVTTYGYHDFLPAESTWTIEAEITEVSDGVYSVTDFSGGLYSVGSYATAYGTTGQPVTFSDICGAITWTGQEDEWGPCVPQDGGVNAVDPSTGVITISWLNTAYGENGVSVYTPK